MLRRDSVAPGALARRAVGRTSAARPRTFPASSEALLCAATAAGIAALLLWLGPPGTDFAAHAYQRALFLRHGITLWDDYWYAGRYSFVGYSVLYYPLAAVLGIRALAVLTAALGAYAFAALVAREFGATGRWAACSFALVWGGYVLTGAFPFALGLALAVVALWALERQQPWVFAVVTLLTVAASPVALVLLVVVSLGAALGRRRWELRPALALAVAIAVELVVLQLFPSTGHYPFPASEAGAALGFGALGLACTWRVERARLLRWVFAVYAVAVAFVWLIPSGLGENIARLRYLAFPLALLVLALRRWRPLPVTVAVAAAALAWNVTPLAAGWNRGSTDRTRHAAVWDFTIRYLRTVHPRPGYRVEAVDTAAHWPAFYLPEAGIPIVRGWFRQDDFPLAALLYRHLTAAAYLRWLRSLGVYYVVLADAPPDYSSRGEANLIRSGQSGLRRVARDRYVTIYRVPRPRPIVTGPGGPSLLALHEAKLAVRVSRAGTYRIAVHWSPYWHPSTGRLSRRPDGMMELRTTGAATVRIGFSFG